MREFQKEVAKVESLFHGVLNELGEEEYEIERLREENQRKRRELEYLKNRDDSESFYSPTILEYNTTINTSNDKRTFDAKEKNV